MTLYDLKRANELMKKIEELRENISLLNDALEPRAKRDKFFFSCKNKNKIHIDSVGVSFGGELKVDRECMELIQNYFKKKLDEMSAEFERIGKGGAE